MSAPLITASATASSLANWLHDAFSAVLPNKGAIYCCGPITSGKSAFDWSRRNGLIGIAYDELTQGQQSSFYREVVDANIRLLHNTADTIRSRSEKPVIDPAGVPPIQGWQQQDWRSFWCDVIRQYVCEIVVVPGWEYSIGAVGEFVCAIALELPVSTSSGERLDACDGAGLILEAVREMEAEGVRCSTLRESVDSLQAIVR